MKRKFGKIIAPFLIAAISVLVALTVIYADSGTYKSSKHGNPDLGVQRDPDLPKGNCSQCHSGHGGSTPNDFSLFAPNDNSLCQSSGCHNYEHQWPAGNYYWSYPGNVPEWYNSAHGSSTELFPQSGNQEVRLCLQCHNPHDTSDGANGVYPSATRFLEEKGCYSNTGVAGEGCHGQNISGHPGAAADIYTQVLKSFRHNIELQAKKHSTDWLADYPYGRESRTVNSGAFSGVNRHVECVDCHNPHKTVAGSHEIGSNNIGGALLGSWGVEVFNGGPWVIPTSFSVVDFVSTSQAKEYSLCFKCHSYFAFGTTPPNAQTDIAREFNPANAAFHPVEGFIHDNSYTSPSAVNGFVETMEAPWDNGQHDLMTCSDCHGSDAPTDPKGPHGSNQPSILIGSPVATGTEFCLKCHKASTYAPAIDPGSTKETGSRFDQQTTRDGDASHWFHVTERHYGCRQCHGGRQNPPPAGSDRRTPYPIEVGSLHGTNSFDGLLNGTNIRAYTPGSCTPTCHGQENYTAGPQ